MAKILGYDENEKKYYKVTCPKCHAVVLFEDSEITPFRGSGDSCAHCPGCDELIIFNKEDAQLSNTDPAVINYQRINNQELINAGTTNHQWPNLTNCRHNCKICQSKCIYRKEDYNPDLV